MRPSATTFALLAIAALTATASYFATAHLSSAIPLSLEGANRLPASTVDQASSCAQYPNDEINPVLKILGGLYERYINSELGLNCGPATARLKELHRQRECATNHSIMIVTSYLRPSGEVFKGASGTNHRAYASRHGYGYLEVEDAGQYSLDLPDRAGHFAEHMGWSKVAILLELLSSQEHKQYEWFFWSDADALFMNHEVSLGFLADLGQFDLVISGDFRGVNTGNFLLKNSDWSRRYMRNVWGGFPGGWGRGQ